MVFPELLEDLCQVAAKFSQVPGVYQDVIDIDDQVAMEELPEHLVQEALEDGWGVS